MRQQLTIVFCAVLLAVSGAAAFQADDISSPKLRIEWDEFKKLYDSQAVVVIDVRGAEAYAAGHIPGSRSISLDVVGRHAEQLKKLGKPLVLYCA